MRRSAENQAEAPGQDSFLDVVANLVGILLVLVMLVAAQAKRGMVAAAAVPATDPAAREADAEAQAAATAAAAIESSVQELEAKIGRQNFEAALRQQERERYQLLVTVAEQRLAEHRDQLSAEEQARYDLEQKLVSSKRELASLDINQVSLDKPKPHVLEHLPTPMARTVFGKEIMFRLQGHRLAYVPWEEMIDRLKADAPRHVSRLRDVPVVEISLPEISGFGARYVLRMADQRIETRMGTVTHHGAEFAGIFFVETEPNLGQPVSQALQPTSDFRSRLAVMKPQGTTVTIWVYPDSFDDFRAIKAELFRLGFLTAARPMPWGQPIGGSPDGTRSSAE